MAPLKRMITEGGRLGNARVWGEFVLRRRVLAGWVGIRRGFVPQNRKRLRGWIGEGSGIGSRRALTPALSRSTGRGSQKRRGGGLVFLNALLAGILVALAVYFFVEDGFVFGEAAGTFSAGFDAGVKRNLEIF
jgi:hypothetical protein